MRRWGIVAAVVFVLMCAAASQAQVAVSVRIGPRPRYVVPVRRMVYPVAPVIVYRPVPVAPVVYRPYPVAPVVIARPLPYCGPICRAQLREERRQMRAERRFWRHEAWEHGWR